MSVAPLVESKGLFKCINGLRYFGVGSRVTRNIYKFPDTYYIITKVSMTTDQLHGRAWGVMVWKGIRKSKIERLGATQKKEWHLVGVPDYSKLAGSVPEFEERVHELVKDYGVVRDEWTPEEKKAALGRA